MAGYLDNLVVKHTVKVCQPYVTDFALANITLAFWLITRFYELSGPEISPAAKS